ncbi:uncharacterized protein LOC119268216 [Triticum dicoccoides]|uniref:uncharacterized protein LOC119268216 n=1 Tax=Triticum dicoccoides TaxID=85692 RepID=UPI00188FB3B4|nr:uncharacterized protein LOC119268216 [Triticum dicoccoides]
MALPPPAPRHRQQTVAINSTVAPATQPTTYGYHRTFTSPTEHQATTIQPQIHSSTRTVYDEDPARCKIGHPRTETSLGGHSNMVSRCLADVAEGAAAATRHIWQFYIRASQGTKRLGEARQQPQPQDTLQPSPRRLPPFRPSMRTARFLHPSLSHATRTPACAPPLTLEPPHSLRERTRHRNRAPRQHHVPDKRAQPVLPISSEEEEGPCRPDAALALLGGGGDPPVTARVEWREAAKLGFTQPSSTGAIGVRGKGIAKRF